MTAKQVMTAVTRRGAPLCRRRFAVVPNVSWGWGLDYEADLIAVSPAGRAIEVEIKISRHDLIQDCKKAKWEKGLDPRIRMFYYAVPEGLVDVAVETVKPFCGIMSVPEKDSGYYRAKIVRRASVIENARPVSPEELNKLLHLGVMRYWDLMLKDQEIWDKEHEVNAALAKMPPEDRL